MDADPRSRYGPDEAMDQVQLVPLDPRTPARAISPMLEMGAYEALWAQEDATAKRVADIFRRNPDALPSDLISAAKADEMARWVMGYHSERGVEGFGVRVHRAGEYPKKLRDARHPVEVLQFRGVWNLVEAPSVAVVGARHQGRPVSGPIDHRNPSIGGSTRPRSDRGELRSRHDARPRGRRWSAFSTMC
jgi:hypothetical protein